MEEIHNTYCHFDWYTNFIIEFVELNSARSHGTRITLANTIKWTMAKQGLGYWYEIDGYLRKHNLYLTEEQILIFATEAREFYTSLYEELKLTNPELFI